MNKLRTVEFTYPDGNLSNGKQTFIYEELGKHGYKKAEEHEVKALNLEGLKIKKEKLNSFKK